MSVFFKYLYVFTLTFVFLPAFAFPLGNRSYRMFFILLILFFILFILLKFRYSIYHFLKLTKLQTVKALLYFLGYVIVSTIILACTGTYNFIHAFSYILQFVFLYVLPSFMFSALFIPNLFKMQNFIKFLLGAYFFIFVFGLFEFTGKIFNIDCIISIQQFLANERAFSTGGLKIYNRLYSVFAEPGWLGYFIFINFPIIYKCCLSKVKFYDMTLVNMVVKKTLIPLAWSNIIFTMSPIWLIACILQVLIIFKNSIIKFLCNLKIIIPVLILTICTILFLINFVFKSDVSSILRIINTLNIKSFDAFVLVEPSLASRIVSYVNSFRLFLSYPILGVGVDNSPVMIFKMFESSPLPLTLGNAYEFQMGILDGRMNFNTAILYRLLCETGFIGTILFYYFMFINLKTVKKIKDNFVDARVSVFCNGLEGSIVAIIVSSIYDSFLNPFFWFFMGIATSVSVFYIAQFKHNNGVR